MASFDSVAPVFLVDDVNATASWASLRRDGAELMLQRLPGHRKPDLYANRRGGVWDAYVRTSGVKRLYEGLKAQPFIKQPLRQQPYGLWEFEAVDPNAYVLVFGGE